MILIRLLALVSVRVGLAFALQSCCGAVKAIPEPAGTLEGKIFVVGNDPFTRLALQSGDGSLHILRCTPETESLLRGNQGKLAKVRYQGTEQAEGEAILRVVAADVPAQ